MGIFGKLGEAIGLKKLDDPYGGMPEDKRAKGLEKALRKDPKADPDTLTALRRSIAIMEKNANEDACIDEFKSTKDMLFHQPLVWLNLFLYMRQKYPRRVYEFSNATAEGKAAMVKVKESIDKKTDTEKEFFRKMELVITKQEIFSSVAQSLQTPKAGNDNNPNSLPEDRMAMPSAANDNAPENQLDQAA